MYVINTLCGNHRTTGKCIDSKHIKIHFRGNFQGKYEI